MAQKELAPIKPHAIGKFLAWREREAESVEMQKRRLKAQLITLAPEEAKFLARYLVGDGLLDHGFAEFAFHAATLRDLDCNREQLITTARNLAKVWTQVVQVTLNSVKLKVRLQAVFPPPKFP